jgi:uncharacterized protein YggE
MAQTGNPVQPAMGNDAFSAEGTIRVSGQQSTGAAPTGQFKVSGVGQVKTRPNQATVYVGEVTEDDDPSESQAKNNRVMEEVIASLKELEHCPSPPPISATCQDQRYDITWQ